MTLPTVHLLFENPAWMPPIVDALQRCRFPVELIHVEEGSIDPAKVPGEGIWWNRMSPSSHTRGHDLSVGFTREILHWLEAHGRRVINGSHALELEVSKLRQEIKLRKHGIRTPRTVLAIGRNQMLELAKTFDGPFITKHNQGGKGLGIELFGSAEQLASYLDSDSYDAGPNGQVVLQEYIAAPEPFITRVELVGGTFVFAMRSNTESGFMLCPSDACQSDVPDVCPADGSAAPDKFTASPLTADDPLVRQLEAFCQAEGLEQAGIEFVEDDQGNRYVYDINGTTNYNLAFGERMGVDGWAAMARYIESTVVPQVAKAA
jgi:hypothetical protein